MIEFPCPGCGFTFQAEESWAGKRATCNQCGERVVIPDKPDQDGPERSPSGLPAIETAPVAAKATPSTLGELAARKRRKRSERTSIDILGLIDFRFERYLTPWIVRATWIAALAITILSLFVLAFFSVAATFMGGTEGIGYRIGWYVSTFALSIITTIVLLLWLRLVLETIIVLFNIAATLREIKESTSD